MPTPIRRHSMRAAVLATCLPLFAQSAHAALTIDSTRVVHPSNKRSSSLVVANPSKSVFAAQVWVNTAADDTTTAVPMLTAPNLFRLEPGGEQVVQINVLPNELPNDRESLFYFNVQELPERNPEARNVLNIALRTRIKVFYRPTQLKELPQSRLGDLEWSVQRLDGKPRLVVDNPSPFHFTFGRLEVNGIALDPKEMAIPLGRQHYPLPAPLTDSKKIDVTFNIINDHGGVTPALTRTALVR
ncbi:MAG: molecular chaperone [Pseudomonas farsensis]|uniref:fimbrial biogenesis chaperone n=1 Tax=Pseudomonas farsensis TaxID=2745492 RepID=UPI003C7DE916